MTATETPRTDPPYRVEATDRPGVYAVVTDTDGGPVAVAAVRGDRGVVTDEDVAAVFGPRKPAALVALEDAVNRRIREVWPR